MRRPCLQTKLITSRRGGYCFEQNLLFAAVLEQMSFPVTRLGARVRYRTTRILPRTHMLLEVEAGGRTFVADVGFGGEGLLFPVPLVPGEPSPQFVWTYRVVREGDAWVLQSQHATGWHDLYVFTLEPQFPVDFEMASHYVSTHPDSRFVQTLTAQLPLPEVRHTLRNHEFYSERPDGVSQTTIADDGHLLQVLSHTFGLEFPAGTRFPFQESRDE
ncbi:MAG TPA: arylamine N-acetyltransferase [Planctomycetaceae bacterium]|nr:arylamine N-acetyltransferase [Planctomycetaceae bacterium]